MTHSSHERLGIAGNVQPNSAPSAEPAANATTESDNAYQLYWENEEANKPAESQNSRRSNAYLRYWEFAETY